jgi:hypothetical protein
MFIGHFAVGFASKRFAPRASLAALVAAPLFLDILWPVFLALQIETVRIVPGFSAVTPLDLHDFPYSHSLLMSILWSLAFSGVAFLWLKDRRAALVLGFGVFSHWLLDALSHTPDMPLYPGSTTLVGLGLWNSVAATLAVEVPLFVAGILVYARTTRARNRTGTFAFIAMIALLTVLYFAALFGPPPPNTQVLIVSAFGGLLFLPWAHWIDKNRALRATPPEL